MFGLALAPARQAALNNAAPAKYTILCIGDSFVSGLGGIGFPEQLQNILDLRHNPGTFKVINRGKAGSNSSYVIVELPEALKTYQPDLVILLTGITNVANPARLDATPGFKSWCLNHFRLLRVFELAKTGQYSLGLKNYWTKRKLFKLEKAVEALSAPSQANQADRNSALASLFAQKAHLHCDIREPLEASLEIDKAVAITAESPTPDAFMEILEACQYCGLPDKGLELAKTAGINDLSSPELAFALAMLYKKNGDFSKARQFLQHALRMNPQAWQYHYELGMLLQAGGENARKYFQQAIHMFPTAALLHYALGVEWLSTSVRDAEAEFKLCLRYDPLNTDALSRLADIYSGRGTPEKFSSLEWELPALASSPIYRNIMFHVNKLGTISEPIDDQQALKKELETDMSYILRAVRASGAAIIVSSYPENNLPGVRETVQKSTAEYVDFTKIFKERFKRRDEYLAYDRFHCDTLGYRVMAETFAAKIENALGLAPGGHHIPRAKTIRR